MKLLKNVFKKNKLDIGDIAIVVILMLVAGFVGTYFFSPASGGSVGKCYKFGESDSTTNFCISEGYEDGIAYAYSSTTAYNGYVNIYCYKGDGDSKETLHYFNHNLKGDFNKEIN